MGTFGGRSWVAAVDFRVSLGGSGMNWAAEWRAEVVVVWVRLGGELRGV